MSSIVTEEFRVIKDINLETWGKQEASINMLEGTNLFTKCILEPIKVDNVCVHDI